MNLGRVLSMSFFSLFSSLALACLLLEAQKLVMTEPGPSFINVFSRYSARQL